MTGAFTLTILLADHDGKTLVSEHVELDTLGSLYAEFGHRPGGYTTQRFLDTVQGLFLRGAQAPRIQFPAQDAS